MSFSIVAWLLSLTKIKLPAWAVTAIEVVGAALALWAVLAFAIHHYEAKGAAACEGRVKVVNTASKAAVKAQGADSTAITKAASGDLKAEQSRIQTITKTIIQKVPVYVSAKADAACTVPVGFVRARDAAAQSVAPVPDATGRSDDADSGVALSRLATVDVKTLGICNGYRAENVTWRGWYSQQAAAWEKNRQLAAPP